MNRNSRIGYALKNVTIGYMCTFVNFAMSFVTRTALIQVMGASYAGVNGLFTSVLGVLSFAELGIGTALNYSLYKPAAENDIEKLKTLMQLYRKAYRVIAFVIAIFGVALIPFLQYLIKTSDELGNIRIYYIIFLFNTVTSYFVSYKFSLVNAMQENYIFATINMITNVATSIGRLLSIYFAKDFLIYLIVGTIIDLIQKIWVSIYLDKRYSLLSDKNIKPLEKEEKLSIWKNVGALVWHKIGDVCVHQTDNIIVSAFVDVSIVGSVTYYTMFVDSAHQLLSVAFNSVVGSLGNAISLETKDKQYELFKTYRFLAFWLYGYVGIGLFFLLTKLVYLLVGENMILQDVVVFLFVLNFYMIGHRNVVNNMKTAGGIFQQDQYIALMQAGVNLFASILFVKLVGLPGVYIGTVIQGTLSTLIRPIIVYPIMFERKATEYFITGLGYLFIVIIAGVSCKVIDAMIFTKISFLWFILEGIMMTIVINVIFLLFTYKTKQFIYLKNIVLRKIKRGA